LHDRQVVPALAVREVGVQLARLRVDDVRGERAGVSAEERVRQRAVAPEEASEVQPHHELGERVEEPAAQVGQAATGEERPVREGELEVAGDQDGVEVGAAARDDADDLHRGDRLVLEVPQQPVLALGQPLGQLLERIEAAVVVDEAHDVARDAAGDLDDPVLLPLLERLGPREVEEVGVAGARDELELHSPYDCCIVALRVCLVSPFDWSQPHDVNEHVAGVAAGLRELGHEVTVVAPSSRARDLTAGRHALLDGAAAETIALGPAIPISRRSRMGVPVGVRANLSLALATGRYDVVHGFEPGLPSLSYLALREAEALAVATFLSAERLGYPPGRAQRERLLARVDALL